MSKTVSVQMDAKRKPHHTLDISADYKEGLEEELSDLNSVISGVTGRIDDQISVIKTQKEEAKYDLERLQHQRTILLYSEEKGMHYINDSKEVRAAKDKVDSAKLEIEIANKQKQIDLIEKEIDLLNEKKDSINEQIDLLDEEIEQINEAYGHCYKDFLFVKDGKCLTPDAVDAQIKRGCEYIGIPVKTMHKIRKTYASTLLHNGVNLSIVKDMLGHADESTTLKHYIYNIENSTETDNKVLNALDPQNDAKSDQSDQNIIPFSKIKVPFRKSVPTA